MQHCIKKYLSKYFIHDWEKTNIPIMGTWKQDSIKNNSKNKYADFLLFLVQKKTFYTSLNRVLESQKRHDEKNLECKFIFKFENFELIATINMETEKNIYLYILIGCSINSVSYQLS